MKLKCWSIWGYLLLTVIVLQSNFILAQNSQIDSLKNFVQTGQRDTAMVAALNELSLKFIGEDQLPEAISTAENARVLAVELKYKKGEAYALKHKGIAEYYQNMYKEVLDSWTQSLEAFESIQDTLGIANLNMLVGAVYYDQGSHAKALDFYLKSLRLSEKINDPVRISSALLNIGGVYSQMLDYDQAIASYKKIEVYLPQLNNPDLQSTYLMGIGEVYSKRGDHQNALKYYKEALVINKDSPDYAHTLTMIGKEEGQLGNTEKAIEYFNLAYDVAKISDLTLDKVQTLLALGNIYRPINVRRALNSYQEAEALAIGIDSNEELRDIYEGMAISYETMGNYKMAYEYKNKYLEFKDVIFNIKTDDKIRGLQFDFDLQKKEDEIGFLEQKAQIAELQAKRQKYVIYGTIISLILVFVMAIGAYSRYKYVKKTNKIIENEKNRSEKLLLNILPEETAKELKEKGKVAAKRFESVTILFSDFKGFTSHAQNLNPEILVKSVDYYFSRFDEIMDKYGLEKIKTVGDAYMCAGGLPFPTSDHPFKMVEAAFEMAAVIEEIKTNPKEDIVPFDVRIGINTGTVVAGVVGLNKFAYDIWGDAVNVASRMETLSDPGRINISENTYKIIKNVYDCEPRGEVEVKNKGMMAMYFVKGRKIIRHAKSEKEVNA